MTKSLEITKEVDNPNPRKILGKSYVNLIMSSNIVSDKLEGLNAKIAKLDPSFTFAKLSNINCYLQVLPNTVLND
jgi:hypothetical protein